MLLERRKTYDNASLDAWDGQTKPPGKTDGRSTSTQKQQDEPPLFCMIYFFASQMSRNLLHQQETAARSSSANTSPTPPPQHKLDAMLSKVSIHASFSPHITRFETFPVEIPKLPVEDRRRWMGRVKEPPSRESIHDTMLLMKFQNKRAREEWIATREWMEFMEGTEREGVFRRLPHVRCARSLKGLRDPMEILSA